MNPIATFDTAFSACPLIAILRGVEPEAVVPIGQALIDAGFTLIEVPLNTPRALACIAGLVESAGDRAMIGAGTVLSPADVDAVAAVGGKLIVSPNTNVAVIEASVAAGLVSLPGIATPSEAFTALAAGAHALKLFPAEGASPTVLKSIRAVLPPSTRVLAVGGIEPGNMRPWLEAGAAGFGLGSTLYQPGFSADAVGERARAFIAAL